MQTYMHVIPGMDQEAADEVVTLILGPEAVDGSGTTMVEDPRDADLDAQGDEPP